MQVIINVSISPTWANPCILDLCSWSADMMVFTTQPSQRIMHYRLASIIYVDLRLSPSIGFSPIGIHQPLILQYNGFHQQVAFTFAMNNRILWSSKLWAFTFGHQTQVLLRQEALLVHLKTRGKKHFGHQNTIRLLQPRGPCSLKVTKGQKTFGFIQMHFTSSMCIKSIHQIISLHEYIIMHDKEKSSELRGSWPQ